MRMDKHIKVCYFDSETYQQYRSHIEDRQAAPSQKHGNHYI